VDAVDAAGFEKDFFSEVMPVVEKNYRLLPGTANRAILGLSMGGGEAMQPGLHHPELFGYIGAFSGVTNYRADLEKMDHAVLNKHRLIWPGAARKSRSLSPIRHLRTGWIPIRSAHVWPVWHKFLAETARQLFRAL
jgi:enterochelin esterase-like enzyme